MSQNQNAVVVNGMSDDDKRALSSFSDAMKAVGPVENVADLIGNGFSVLTTAEKQRLVSVEFVILGWRFGQGDSGEFVSLEIVTKADEKLIVNDGSTGIYAQVKALGQSRPIYVEHGLRRSDFYYNEKTGEIARTGGPGFAKATTYYLSA